MLVKRSFEEVTEINTLTLRSFGALPLGGSPSTWKTGFGYLLVTFEFFCHSVIVDPLIHFLLVTPFDPDVTLHTVSVVIGLGGGQMRALLMILKSRKIQRLLRTHETLWADANHADYGILSVWGNLGCFLTKAYIGNGLLTGVMYVSAPILQMMTSDNSTSRILPFQMIMNTSQSPQYEIVYVVQIVAIHSCITTITACDAIVLVLILNGCGQLKLVQTWLKDMNDALSRSENEVSESCRKALKRCIQRHRIVLDYCTELEELVSNFNLVQVFCVTYMIALVAANLFGGGEGAFKLFAILIIGTCQLFFLCWPSQELSTESFEIANLVYSLPWYRFSKCDQTAIMIMMMRAQRSAKLTAGKYVELSMETFCNIISSAISFFMVLQNV